MKRAIRSTSLPFVWSFSIAAMVVRKRSISNPLIMFCPFIWWIADGFSLHLHARFPRGDAFQIIYRVEIDDGGERAVQFGNFGFVFIAEGKVKDVQVFRHPYGFAFCIVRGNRRTEMVELVINQVGLCFGLPLGFGRDFQQRIGFGVVAVRLGGFVFPFYAYRRGSLKLRQRFECTGFEQVMGILSVCTFNGKGVF